MKWIKKGFKDFRKGILGNGGQNLYVSAKGVLQRIYNFDINGDGYVDIPFANAHSMFEKPPLHIYDSLDQIQPLKLPSNGSFDAIFADLTGDGTDDLIVACQHNGVHTDVSAVIYYASEQGLSEKYKRELRVPNSFGVAAGDFRGTGKQDLAFISNDKLRIFYQTELGIEASRFVELDIAGIALAAGDLDGDGYDDLYVLHQNTGELAVYWGDKDGIDPERKTVFGVPTPLNDSRAASTTAGRKLYRWVPWKNAVLCLKDKMVTFRAEKNYAVFESFGADRQPREELRICCTQELVEKDYGTDAVFEGYGPMHACVGDLKNDGSRDIVIAVATDFEKIDDVLVLWEDQNYALEAAGRIPVMTARSVTVGPVEKDGQNYLFVSLSSTKNELDVPAKAFAFDKQGQYRESREFATHECVKLMSGKTYKDGRYQVVAVNHEGEYKLGLEEAWVFLGGPDGYRPDRYLAFPTHAGVDTHLADLTDNGYPDILCANSGENAIELNPGATVYFNGPDGFDTEKRFHDFHTYSAHGCAIGDFRHSGYLDVITGGIHMRDLQIFEGGPDGFPKEATKRLIMGPEPESYVSRNDKTSYDWEDDDAFLRGEYGEVRWLFTADFNNDGWLDLLVSQITGSRAFLFWGGPEGFSRERMQEIATDGVAAANAADLDGDGYLDLVLASHLSKKHTIPNEYGKLTVYWGGKDGYSENRRTELPTYCANALTIQDFNNDGLLDLYATAYNNGRLRDIDSKLFFQSEDGMFHQENFQFLFNHSGCGCLAGDFNGDGYVDLAVASHKKDGSHVCDSYIFWGGPDGINETRYTALPTRGPHGMHSVDIGNIMDRTDSEYYTSEAYLVPEGKHPVQASWQAANGPKTWVKMQLRSADTEDALESAPWSESVENGDSLMHLPLAGKYLQYRLELGATCGCGTPRVTQVTVEFE